MAPCPQTLATRFCRDWDAADSTDNRIRSPENVHRDARIDFPNANARTCRCQSPRCIAKGSRLHCRRRQCVYKKLSTPTFFRRGCASIGTWTAQYVAMRALGDPDAFPSRDLGLLRAAGLRNFHDLERHAEAWRPWRAYAAMYLWRLVSENRPSGKSSLTRSRSRRGAPTAPRRITLAA